MDLTLNFGHIIQSILAMGMLGLGTAATRALISLSGEVREIRVQLEAALKSQEDHERRIRHIEAHKPR